MGLTDEQYRSNWNEQIEEILTLRSIYGTEFRLTEGFEDHKFDPGGDLKELVELPAPNPPITVFCGATVYVEIPEGKIELSMVTSSSSSQPQLNNSVEIQHLPAINFELELIPTYPETEKPNFTLSCCWLSHQQLSQIGQELDKVWDEEGPTPICFSWINWLHTNLLETLGFTGSSGIVLNQYGQSLNLDPRVNLSTDNIPLKTTFRNISEYNRIQSNLSFQNEVCVCPICMNEDFGRNFVRFHDCLHYFCKECFSQYCSINIRDGQVNLSCPGHKCQTSVHPSLLKSHVSKDEYNRWETLLLQRTLEAMNDIRYCPRCNTACVEESGNFSQCAKCHFAFCTKCYSAWHPGSDCVRLHDKLKELEESELVSAEKAKHMQDLKNQTLSLNVIEKETKPCPWCGMAIEKMGGCNHMVCIYCNTHYCYICEVPIFDDYSHFGVSGCVLFNQDAIDEWEREMNPAAYNNGAQPERDRNREERIRPDFHRMIRCKVCKAMNYKMDKNNHIKCYSCSASICFLCKEVLPKKNATSHFHLGKCEQHTDL